MRNRIPFLINLVLTCITIIVIMFSCSGCTLDELQTGQKIVEATATGAAAAGPVLVNQPWYVFVLLAADIASSVFAAWIAYKKSSAGAVPVAVK